LLIKVAKKLKNKIAISDKILSCYPTHDAVDLIGKMGYEAMKALKNNNMTGVIHCPLRNLSVPKPYKYNICSKDAKLRNESLKETIKAVELAKKMGFKVITIHPGHTDKKGEKADKKYWELQIDAFKRFAKRAEKLNVKIGLEPMEHLPKQFVTEPKHADRIIDAVNSKNLGITFDLIHAYTHGVKKPIEFLDGLHPNIFHVHVSGHTKKKQHAPFSMTIIPHSYLDKVLNRVIKKYSYSGIISIEGHTFGLEKQTKTRQKKIAKDNLAYIHKELKALHLE
jgi:sugar phosphate isomerase/epimerase